jgi:DNA-binding response OmpR family regulator
VVIDIGLPDGDGFQLTAHMRSMSWQPRILLISSDSDAATDPEARRAGRDWLHPEDRDARPTVPATAR